jgi:hypothetical protein
MDETEELIGLCCRALVAQVSAAPGFELHMTRNCVLGLTAAGTAPLMVLRAGTPVQPRRPTKITRALGAELVGIAGDLVAAAFDVPRDAVAR